VGRSGIHGGGVTRGQVGEGGSSPKLLADGKGGKTGMVAAFSDEVGAPVADIMGRKRELRRRCTRRKRRQWGAPTIGWLLTASSCTDGEKVVRAAAGFREKRSGAVMRGGRRRDGLTGGGAECSRETRQHGTLGLRGDGAAFGPALSGRPRGGRRFMAPACTWQCCRGSVTQRGTWHARWTRCSDEWFLCRER
jgi:hypothetical protein